MFGIRRLASEEVLMELAKRKYIRVLLYGLLAVRLIREEEKREKFTYTNGLHSALLRKDAKWFWNSWHSKFEPPSSWSQVEGWVDENMITDKFAQYFCTSDHPSAFVLNGPRLVVVATLGWRNGPLLSTRSDDDDVRPRMLLLDYNRCQIAWLCCHSFLMKLFK